MQEENKTPKGKPAKALADISPPGKVIDPGKHGPQEPVLRPRGTARLRKVMRVSGDVPIDILCDEAAVELERLRTEVARRK